MAVNPRIKGLSEVRRLPRLGKIRLGIKKEKGSTSYPSETDYFVCPAEVMQVYGAEPKEIDIMFPLDDEGEVFKQNYKWYTFSSLKCKGDGEVAMRRVQDLTGDQKAMIEDVPKDQFEMVEVSCPCPLLESGKCGQVGSLSFMIPKVSWAGVYQIDTRSFHSIVNINSALALARAMAGRISMIPFKLKRMAQKIDHDGKMETHYILSLEHTLTTAQVESIRGEKLLTGPMSIAVRENPGPMAHNFTEEGGGSGGAVEDVDPQSIKLKEIEVSIKEVVQPTTDAFYTIMAQEMPPDTPVIEFKTPLTEDARTAYKIMKETGARANVTYKIGEQGTFYLEKIVKDIPF